MRICFNQPSFIPWGGFFARLRQKIKDLEIYEKKRWAKDFLLTLQHFYAKSLYLQPVHAEIKSVLETRDESFLNPVLALLTILKKNLGIDNQRPQ